MEGAYKVEVLPPIGEDSSLPQRGKSAVLGEESVGIVFELVFRDIKMLSRTALQRPWPVVFELAQERLDMVVWFARYKADQCNLRLHDEVARSLDSLPAPRRVKSVLGIDKCRHSPLLLRIGGDRQCKRCLARRFWSIDFNNPTTRNATTPQSKIKAQTAS